LEKLTSSGGRGGDYGFNRSRYGRPKGQWRGAGVSRWDSHRRNGASNGNDNNPSKQADGEIDLTNSQDFQQSQHLCSAFHAQPKQVD
jgi:hypothetical protein